MTARKKAAYRLDDLARAAKVRQTDARAFVDALIRQIEVMDVGSKIVIKNLGKFEKVLSKARTGTNPKTQKKIVIKAKPRIKFRASVNLRAS